MEKCSGTAKSVRQINVKPQFTLKLEMRLLSEESTKIISWSKVDYLGGLAHNTEMNSRTNVVFAECFYVLRLWRFIQELMNSVMFFNDFMFYGIDFSE